MFSSQSGQRRRNIKLFATEQPEKSPGSAAPEFEVEKSTKGIAKPTLDDVFVKSPFSKTGNSFFKNQNTVEADALTRHSDHAGALSTHSKRSALKDRMSAQKGETEEIAPITPTKDRAHLVYTAQERPTGRAELPSMLEKSLPHLD